MRMDVSYYDDECRYIKRVEIRISTWWWVETVAFVLICLWLIGSR
jgi:hypothetical protein